MGGKLVLNASTGHNKWVGIIIVSMLLSAIPYTGNLVWIAVRGKPSGTEANFGEIVYVLFLIALWVLSGRCEFRQSGLMTATSFYRWPNIASYCWSENTRTERAVLTLNLHGRHPLFSTPKIMVPLPKKPEVEAVMTRFLSEWPGNTEK